jgi:hypothetical protein
MHAVWLAVCCIPSVHIPLDSGCGSYSILVLSRRYKIMYSWTIKELMIVRHSLQIKKYSILYRIHVCDDFLLASMPYDLWLWCRK